MSSGTIQEPTKIINEGALEISESSRIDQFCFINGNGGVRLREQSVIHAGSHVVGNGNFDMGPRSVITYNCVVLTSTADLGYPASSTVPDQERRDITDDVRLENETFVGSGAVIMPGVTLRKGAAVAANAYISEDVPPWTIRFPNGAERERPRESPIFK
jgi:acetyltransferase-like isoleucine patch superfamily enzyme